MLLHRNRLLHAEQRVGVAGRRAAQRAQRRRAGGSGWRGGQAQRLFGSVGKNVGRTQSSGALPLRVQPKPKQPTTTTAAPHPHPHTKKSQLFPQLPHV